MFLQSQKEYPSDLGNCRDKFLVQSVPAPDGDEVTSDLFDKSKNKVSENQRVAFGISVCFGGKCWSRVHSLCTVCLPVPW